MTNSVYCSKRSTRLRLSAARITVLILIAVALFVGGVAGGAGTMWYFEREVRGVVAEALPRAHVAKDTPSPEDQMDLLVDVWDILEAEFIDPEATDDQRMLHGAAAGMTSSLGDPHTVFVEPLPASIMSQDMEGSFEGIGATVDMVEGRLTIVRPLPDSPAAIAGLEPGDVILAVDDESLEGKSILEAIDLIRGPRGTVVRLLVERKGTLEPFVVPVTREKVDLPVTETRVLEGGVAYLRLTEFNAVAAKRVREGLEELLADDPVGLVFDLRGNPGGYLHMAVEVASEYLPKDSVVLVEKQRDKDDRAYRATAGGKGTEIPLVVLVNNASASASEIVAGAIKDNDRGVLLGEATYGKGSVQNTHTLDDGSSLRVTVARWHLPSGRSLDGEGIAPDIVVARTAEDIAAGRDPQLEGARAYLLEGK